MEWIKIGGALLAGLICGFVFVMIKLPIPAPPTLPEPPSFIPSVKMSLPVLPPAPKIPKLIPEINGILKAAEFIGKVFCIVK